MKKLGLKFRVEELGEDPRDFEGELVVEALKDVLTGLAGQLGYRPMTSAEITGSVYRSARGHIETTGTLKASVQFDCARCLATQQLDVDTQVRQTLMKKKSSMGGRGEIIVSHLDDDDDHTYYYEGDEIDLGATFQEDLILALPMNPKCESVGIENCVNAKLAFSEEGSVVDPRWAPLLELKKKLN
ncbi:MAG: DUF177 domain-containing protein [Myxococcota bacterium]|nr:DUF177 domain-containing protein [Myxococcota bacterium]